MATNPFASTQGPMQVNMSTPPGDRTSYANGPPQNGANLTPQYRANVSNGGQPDFIDVQVAGPTAGALSAHLRNALIVAALSIGYQAASLGGLSWMLIAMDAGGVRTMWRMLRYSSDLMLQTVALITPAALAVKYVVEMQLVAMPQTASGVRWLLCVAATGALEVMAFWVVMAGAVSLLL